MGWIISVMSSESFMTNRLVEKLYANGLNPIILLTMTEYKRIEFNQHLNNQQSQDFRSGRERKDLAHTLHTCPVNYMYLVIVDENVPRWCREMAHSAKFAFDFVGGEVGLVLGMNSTEAQRNHQRDRKCSFCTHFFVSIDKKFSCTAPVKLRNVDSMLETDHRIFHFSYHDGIGSSVEKKLERKNWIESNFSKWRIGDIATHVNRTLVLPIERPQWQGKVAVEGEAI